MLSKLQHSYLYTKKSIFSQYLHAYCYYGERIFGKMEANSPLERKILWKEILKFGI